MERRLLPINAWIALHKGEAGWPARLKEQGFAIHKFEMPMTVPSGNVVVDATSIREDPPTVVATESKSGGNISNEQAKRYAEIRPIHVARHAGLPFPHTSAATKSSTPARSRVATVCVTTSTDLGSASRCS